MAISIPACDSLDFYVAAKGFKEAAKYIHVSEHAAGNEPLVFLPIQTLIGFSLELYLKAWLANTGTDEAALRNRYGHNLSKLVLDARKAGLPDLPGLEQTVQYTAQGHKNYTYRYFSRHLEYTSMGLHTTFPVLDMLDEVVDAAIGASISKGKLPGH